MLSGAHKAKTKTEAGQTRAKVRERWQRSGDTKCVRHYDGDTRHPHPVDLTLGSLGKSATRPRCHAASKAIQSHSCHGYHNHRHNISIIPRSEKHAPPFWVSFLAAWLKARRGRKWGRRGRRWMLKVCLRHAGGGGRVHPLGSHQRTNVTRSHRHNSSFSHKNPNWMCQNNTSNSSACFRSRKRKNNLFHQQTY